MLQNFLYTLVITLVSPVSNFLYCDILIYHLIKNIVQSSKPESRKKDQFDIGHNCLI